ncbi:MAG: hypothetical protein J6B01_11940 [Ruminococcus sp.]|nr:hypothetical protein [Ruminococcus sp.]
MHAKDVKAILSTIPKGETLTISQIQALVKASFPLSAGDWAIHTNTRPTNYRRWLHRIQGVLSEYKRKGIVKHNKIMHSYTF